MAAAERNMSVDAEAELRLTAMRLLVYSDAESKEVAAQVASRGLWSAVVGLCAQWKLLSGLEARLALLGVDLPVADRAALARRTQPAFVQTMLCVRSGVMALSTLQQAGIRCAGFKGLAALAYLYPSARNRTLQDVDVLIHPRDVEAALGVLEQAGFQRSPDGPWEEYVTFLRNSPGTAGNEAVSLRDEKGGAVDLHWRLGGLDVETLLACAATVAVLNRPLPLMSAGHSMLLSVHHALRNDFVPGDIARDICDFVYWEALLSKTGQWDSIRTDAERWGLSAACVAIAFIVAEFRGIPGIDSPLSVSRADLAAAQQLAALYLRQLYAGPVNTDLAYVASARPLMQVVSGLGGGWKQYREFMRRSEESNGEVSLSMQARLWNLGKAFFGLSPHGWRQIRVLARAKEKMAGSNRPS